MAGYDQYKSAAALPQTFPVTKASFVGPNKGVYITFIGATADGGNAHNGGAGITFTTVSNQEIGLVGFCGATASANLPYIFPVAIRNYTSLNTDNKIYLLH